MGFYRKKPIVIEAIRWVGQVLADDDPAWWREARTNKTVASGSRMVGGALVVNTKEGVMLVSQGNWVIRGVNGELYGCDDDVFRKTYDPMMSASEVGGAL